jgi:hypothetical protein
VGVGPSPELHDVAIALARSGRILVQGVLHEGSAVPYQRQAEVVLASLRGVERELESSEPKTPEAEFLRSTAARLRNEYQRLVEQARENDRPEPPPLPEELGRSVT